MPALPDHDPVDTQNLGGVFPACDVNAVLPSSLDAFVGQKAVVEVVKVGLQASRNSGSPFPSALFTGAAGLGKSQLVGIIANEMGVELRETLAQTLTTTGELGALLLEAQRGDIVFLDEADALPEAQQVLLYRALAEKKLFVPRGGSGRAARALPLEDFTLILASNHESRLASPLVQRFKLLCRFEFYTTNEIANLLTTRIEALGWTCGDGVVAAVAQRSRGVPRVGLRVLEAVYRVAQSEGGSVLTLAHAERACRMEGLDHRGLDRTERAYLTILAAASGPVRLGVIADRLGLPARTISSCVEAYLVREGLISRSDEGRELTEAGARYVQSRDFTDAG